VNHWGGRGGGHVRWLASEHFDAFVERKTEAARKRKNELNRKRNALEADRKVLKIEQRTVPANETIAPLYRAAPSVFHWAEFL